MEIVDNFSSGELVVVKQRLVCNRLSGLVLRSSGTSPAVPVYGGESITRFTFPAYPWAAGTCALCQNRSETLASQGPGV